MAKKSKTRASYEAGMIAILAEAIAEGFEAGKLDSILYHVAEAREWLDKAEARAKAELAK